MPRPSNPAVLQRLLAAGKELIFSRGFNGCGVQEITAAAGIPKGSFYNYFDTKEAFAIAVLEEYWRSLDQRFGPILQDTTSRPLERITKYFHSMAEENELRKFTLGCLIGNLALEMSDSSLDARRKLSDLFERWEAPLAACLREAQKRKEIPADKDVSDLAAAVIEAWEGAVMRGKVEQRRGAYRRFETVVLPSLLNR